MTSRAKDEEEDGLLELIRLELKAIRNSLCVVHKAMGQYLDKRLLANRDNGDGAGKSGKSS